MLVILAGCQRLPRKRRQPRSRARRSARDQASPQAEPAARVETPDDLLARTVFQVILGEIALRRGDNELASNAYADLALRTRDPQVLERTIEVASHARAGSIWPSKPPAFGWMSSLNRSAQQMLVSTMMLVGQLDGVAL